MSIKTFALMICLSCAFLFTSISSKAQVYNNALGLNAGWLAGISYKKFWDPHNDYTIFFHSYSIYLGYRQNMPMSWLGGRPYSLSDTFSGYGLDIIKSLNYVVNRYLMLNIGLGWAFGLDDYRLHADYDPDASRDRFRYSLGLCGALGLEYVKPNSPLSIELAFVSRFELWYLKHLLSGLTLFSPSLAVRYIIN